MFKSKTLFIVGAGASCEAGLPSGEDLKGKIASLLDIRFEDGYQQNAGDLQISDALREAAKVDDPDRININPYLEKAWRIRDVVPTAAISIDNFLDAHRGDKKMELCGKLGIVRSILQAERGSKLSPLSSGDDKFNLRTLSGSWYLSFLQMLTENVHRSEVEDIFDNVSFITFNYDRCIEQFIPQALSEYYDLPMADAYRIASTLTIFHPYGQVGKLPWQDHSRAVPFGSDRGNLLALTSEIKTFSEGLHDNLMLRHIHHAVSEAQTIVFLGFAFHPMNMSILKPDEYSNEKRVFSTSFGLSSSDQSVIEDDIFEMLYHGDVSYSERMALKPEMASLKCGDFFRHFFRSLSAAAPSEE